MIRPVRLGRRLIAGLPPEGTTLYPEDASDLDWSRETWLAIPLEVVKGNFER